MSTRTDRGPRDRLVFQAAQKLRAAGLSGASMRHVAEAAHAPRGSLQHYFPGGKDQLVEEALAWAGEHAAGYVQAYLDATDRPTSSGLLGCIADYWVAELHRSDYDLGCPMVGAVAGGTATPRSRAAAAATLRTWSAPIAAGLRRAGVPADRVPAQVTAILAAVEGAIILARIDRTDAPLRDVVTILGPALDGSAPSRAVLDVPDPATQPDAPHQRREGA